MTTLRFPHRRGAAMTAAGLLAAAAVALTLTGPPAAADPSPQPSPSGQAASGGAAKAAPGSITWSVQASSAQGPDGRRSFSYNKLKPGIVVHDYVAVTNFSAMPVSFDLYATDAFNDASGTLTLLPANQKPTDIGSWVSDLKKTVTLAPNERANEPFTLTVPSTATPGDHAGGIIASVSIQGKNSQGALVKVDRRLGIPLNLRVDGPLTPGLKIESVSSVYHGTANPLHGGGVDVNYTVHNTGNIRLNLTQDVAAKGLFGLAKLRGIDAKPLTDLLPGATYHATLHLSNVFPLGPISVRVHAVPSQPADTPPLSGAKLQDQSFSVSMWATPWLVFLVIVLLVGAFFLVRWQLASRRARNEQVLVDVMEEAKRQTVEQLKRKATATRTKVAAGAGGSGSGGSGKGDAAKGAGRSDGGKGGGASG
ncbi:MAG: DUF916 domain-containing protein [Micromonosporaceae bacterium]|nr:DUF916 domain-containing protein [Micromonosporaceae bacterium]